MIDKFLDDVFDKYFTDITDKIFTFIQNDKCLMQEYLKLVGQKGRDTVNRELGKKIKNRLGLSVDGRCNSSQSTLIQSHTELKK